MHVPYSFCRLHKKNIVSSIKQVLIGAAGSEKNGRINTINIFLEGCARRVCRPTRAGWWGWPRTKRCTPCRRPAPLRRQTIGRQYERWDDMMEGSLILLMPNLFLILSWYLSCELFFVWIQFFRSGSISITKHSLRSPNFLSMSVTPAECAFFFWKLVYLLLSRHVNKPYS